jgi:hypothetical protein
VVCRYASAYRASTHLCIPSSPLDTDILPFPLKVILAGLPYTPIERVVGAVFYSATDVDPTTNGNVWLVSSDHPLLRLEPELLTSGVYGLMNERFDWGSRCDKNIYFSSSLAFFIPLIIASSPRQVSKIRMYADLVRLFRGRFIGKQSAWILFLTTLAVAFYFGKFMS